MAHLQYGIIKVMHLLCLFSIVQWDEKLRFCCICVAIVQFCKLTC